MNKHDYIAQWWEFWNIAFQEDTYANPGYLWLMLAAPFLIVLLWLKGKRDRFQLKVGRLSAVLKPSGTNISWSKVFANVLAVMAFVVIVVALARPQSKLSWSEEKALGIDIVVALDVSTSMKSRDFKPNRLEASKKIAAEFVATRPNDRSGLVVFAAEAFTQCPLTIDHKRLSELFFEVKTGLLEDGTAIGEGLATAVDRLRNSSAKSKVIVLLSDGENNRGDITPKMASELAKSFGIKVYTIGVGRKGIAEQFLGVDRRGREVYQPMQVKIDEKTLKYIAENSGGKYFRAENNKALKEIYKEIDALEKTEMASVKYSEKNDLFAPLLLFSSLLLIVYVLIEVFFNKKLYYNWI